MFWPFLAMTVFVMAPATVIATSDPANGEAGRVMVRPAAVTVQRSRLISVLLIAVVVMVYADS